MQNRLYNILLSIVLGSLVLLGGCGQKGPLYLPDETQQNAAQK
ncbi:lipoprotein [Neptuniibacter sp. CAU 1671]|nr:lipoprotein [Neptuniibacter sp. CAU 1671]MDF2182404.1 lipoprotein [Neptuniibacter sp. CAU 1671]